MIADRRRYRSLWTEERGAPERVMLFQRGGVHENGVEEAG